MVLKHFNTKRNNVPIFYACKVDDFLPNVIFTWFFTSSDTITILFGVLVMGN